MLRVSTPVLTSVNWSCQSPTFMSFPCLYCTFYKVLDGQLSQKPLPQLDRLALELGGSYPGPILNKT